MISLKISKRGSGLTIAVMVLVVSLCGASGVRAEGTVHKVLVHYLDLDGHHRKSPSLFERDVYQEFLRTHPEQVSAIAFDVLWKVPQSHKRDLSVRLEIRGSENYQTAPMSMVVPVNGRKYFKTWSRVTLNREEIDSIGKIVAWKVTVEEDGKALSSHHSFLWQRPPDEKGVRGQQPPANGNGQPGIPGGGFPRNPR